MAAKLNTFFACFDKSRQVVRNVIAYGMVCMLLFAVVSCEGSKPSETDILFDEPINVPFTEISLLEACECEHWGCGWMRVNTESELVIINSDRELRRHVICAENVPVIDFSRYTLLLARGFSGNSRTPICIRLEQLSPRSYEMSLLFQLNLTHVVARWNVAIIIDRLDRNDNVTLNVTGIL